MSSVRFRAFSVLRFASNVRVFNVGNIWRLLAFLAIYSSASSFPLCFKGFLKVRLK